MDRETGTEGDKGRGRGFQPSLRQGAWPAGISVLWALGGTPRRPHNRDTKVAGTAVPRIAPPRSLWPAPRLVSLSPSAAAHSQTSRAAGAPAGKSGKVAEAAGAFAGQQPPAASSPARAPPSASLRGCPKPPGVPPGTVPSPGPEPLPRPAGGWVAILRARARGRAGGGSATPGAGASVPGSVPGLGSGTGRRGLSRGTGSAPRRRGRLRSGTPGPLQGCVKPGVRLQRPPRRKLRATRQRRHRGASDAEAARPRRRGGAAGGSGAEPLRPQRARVRRTHLVRSAVRRRRAKPPTRNQSRSAAPRSATARSPAAARGGSQNPAPSREQAGGRRAEGRGARRARAGPARSGGAAPGCERSARGRRRGRPHRVGGGAPARGHAWRSRAGPLGPERGAGVPAEGRARGGRPQSALREGGPARSGPAGTRAAGGTCWPAERLGLSSGVGSGAALAAPPETTPRSGAGTSSGAASSALGSTAELGGLLWPAGSRGTPCPSTQTFGSHGILGSDPGEDLVASGLRMTEGWRGGNRRENELATLERRTWKAHLCTGAHWPCEQLDRGDPPRVTGFWNWEAQTDPARRRGGEEPGELFGSSLRPATTPPPRCRGVARTPRERLLASPLQRPGHPAARSPPSLLAAPAHACCEALRSEPAGPLWPRPGWSDLRPTRKKGPVETVSALGRNLLPATNAAVQGATVYYRFGSLAPVQRVGKFLTLIRHRVGSQITTRGEP